MKYPKEKYRRFIDFLSFSLFCRIDKMRESGLLKKWTAEWTPSNLQCKGLGPVTTATEATLDDFQGAFYLLIIGVLLACVFLVVEMVYSYRTEYVLENEDEYPVLEADIRLGHTKGHHKDGKQEGDGDLFGRKVVQFWDMKN